MVDRPVTNSLAKMCADGHPLPREVLRHGNDAMWGDRTSQTVGIAGDGEPIGSTLASLKFSVGWHKHDKISDHIVIKLGVVHRTLNDS